ncbi:MAG: hypothetical protein COZ06_32155 [Armatimonadetes bacterium CG_4_10_14_3_um_filter_66_18]|nr:DUF362 domain-containing protein [Armatimonadota bacterium]OIP05674.1 MAG: hypothetical protein AUJ96_10285 [Armatimonadetes bacterium CG2_30_66_41]PIU91611.1 MAG: hypothetical protein COS65_21630 [Armatimonadetes bacterium CG06_land_8_20_14_3_00_66_21]PIX46499.1 MAG: hypothetical protein COZ57_11705 [Armatimonadetes bacterium CG_4_8_14_3_um_filter_66_20]PIY37769.1 MAG: hypothetical protein COZ06_32155 [Armatimonadetes bacterium CG_4_10_14_3_um_filter_66_18]PIZ48916.1 MAG: hypothetical prot
MPADPNLSRRQFLKQSAAGVATAGLTLEAARVAEAAPAALPKSKVVVVTNSAIGAPESMNQDAVTATVRKAVCTLFGTDDVAAAFGRLATRDDIVALKPNCAGGTKANGTRLQVMIGLTNSLNAAGVPYPNMIVYEQDERLLRQSGYPILKDKSNIRIMGVRESIGYSQKSYKQGEVEQRLAKVLEECSVLLNCPFLKTCPGFGVTLAMKNHQGSIQTPRLNHPPASRGGAPHLADLSMIPLIRQKTKLVLCDATYPLYDGGPGDKPDAHWAYNTLLAATDPVALDAVGYQILDDKRKELGLDPIADVPAHIKVADMRRLGNGDLSNIERVDISMG